MAFEFSSNKAGAIVSLGDAFASLESLAFLETGVGVCCAVTPFLLFFSKGELSVAFADFSKGVDAMTSGLGDSLCTFECLDFFEAGVVASPSIEVFFFFLDFLSK